MPRNKSSIQSITTLAILTLSVIATGTRVSAQQEKVLHSFSNTSGRDGFTPMSGLVFDKAGNLYGTTCQGGTYNMGTVYQMAPKAGGAWGERVIHNFESSAGDGGCPSSSLIIDKAGNLYGTAPQGGAGFVGVVFELSPKAGGGWSDRILHAFNERGTDGSTPYGGLVMDAAGNLYGTTEFGSSTQGYGTVFELSPSASGKWTEKILYNFVGNSNGFFPNGDEPTASLILDSAGNLYGTTQGGGAYGFGTVFELSPAADGTWTETVLHSFNNNFIDGSIPQGGVVFDSAGNLYGGTEGGGADDDGVVYELSPAGDGTWTETLIHTFTGGKDGGVMNWEAPIFDSAGNLYGVTSYGGTHSAGTVFKLTPNGDGSWVETILHNFNNTSGDGQNPASSLIFDSQGNLYGTTIDGPANGGDQGTVFVVRP